jgi:hypothetical protein
LVTVGFAITETKSFNFKVQVVILVVAETIHQPFLFPHRPIIILKSLFLCNRRHRAVLCRPFLQHILIVTQR